MNDVIKVDKDYKKWVNEIKKRYAKSQIKASVAVNKNVLAFYWSLGQDISERSFENIYGSGFYNTLSKDLKAAIPNVEGFSVTNIKYMRRFYDLYHRNHPQVVDDFTIDQTESNHPQAVDDLSDHASTDLSLEELFSIPWGHHRYIIDKCKGDAEKAVFYVKKTIQNNWSRAVLLNFLDTDLYERQGKAISNFLYSLPAEQGDLAQEITKDPYNFDFIAIREKYNEEELKTALMDNITRFLLELGKHFAFVGKEYPLPIPGTEERIDLLFYHLKLHCYIVVEVKVRPFKPGDIGQIGTYINIVDDIVKSETDGKTIGLIICKDKNSVLAKYAVNSSAEPIGISSYELSNLLPEEVQDVLPSIEEIENVLEADNI
ncbi:MAG: PDDEXK nuclease domain-containing protein [Lachnospiraceae bacterium]|nr:PDDEXK nuclease domain-containing protein [Lachnospiraceae bacterium]